MLKFAICDDLTTEANTLKNHIERYAREKSLRVEIDAYSETRRFVDRAIKAASSFSLHQKSTRWTPSASTTATI